MLCYEWWFMLCTLWPREGRTLPLSLQNKSWMSPPCPLKQNEANQNKEFVLGSLASSAFRPLKCRRLDAPTSLRQRVYMTPPTPDRVSIFIGAPTLLKPRRYLAASSGSTDARMEHLNAEALCAGEKTSDSTRSQRRFTCCSSTWNAESP